MHHVSRRLFCLSLLGAAIATGAARADVTGWLRWRGPTQNGVSYESGLPDAIDAADAAWTYDVRGRGAPVIAQGRVYFLGYEGDGPDLDQMIICADEATGRRLWEWRHKDFLSDTVYDRYAISSPSIDPETGQVYFLATEGILNCFKATGELVWQQSLTESYGMLTYPNGRTMGPLVDGDLVIVHCMTSSWGPEGPARNRFLAFDKKTGEHVWTSSPDGPPKDNPYSFPVFEWRDGKRLLYAGVAGGAMVCVNVRTGEPVWYFDMSVGGVCASPVLSGDQLIAIHARENIDSSTLGRTVAIRLGATPQPGQDRPLNLGRDHEAWRIDQLGAFSSSPVLVGDRMYITTDIGELVCVNVAEGSVLWREKLAPDQIHASPAYGDGKLYVPMNNGSLYVIRPSDDGPQILSQTHLEGNCLAAPSIWNGRIYIHTTQRLYCFGAAGRTVLAPAAAPAPPVGPAVAMQVIPGDVSIQPGEAMAFRVRLADAAGQVVRESDLPLTWQPNPLGVAFDGTGRIVDSSKARSGAAVLTAEAGGMKDTVRLRVTYPMPFTETFDGIALTLPDPDDSSAKVARPPSHWLGSGPKWDIRQVGDTQIVAKTLADPIFQRTFGFFGHPDWHDYTIEADMMVDGSRRMISSIGVVNQRYLLLLKGNYQELEIQSNHERVKHSVPFAIRPGVWYRLRMRCDNGSDGSVTIRGKAWPRDEAEPEGWTIEYTHANGHRHGAAGLFGFSINDRFKVFMDNLAAHPNQ